MYKYIYIQKKKIYTSVYSIYIQLGRVYMYKYIYILLYTYTQTCRGRAGFTGVGEVELCCAQVLSDLHRRW
jgi:hypothetical protein